MPALEILLLAFSFLLLVALSIFDLKRQLVPNYLTLGGYPLFVALLLASSTSSDEVGQNQLVRAGIGSLGLFAFFAVSRVIKPNNVGVGDLKIAPLYGAVLAYMSWASYGVGLGSCFLASGLYALILLILKRADGKTHLPLIPFMLFGFTIAFVTEYF